MDLPQSVVDQIASLKKGSKELKRTNSRLSKKLTTVKQVVLSLKKESLVTSDRAETMESNFSNLQLEFLDKRHDSSGDNQSYSDEMKKFSLYLYYCSLKAYEFIRKKIKLPSVRTVRRWLATISCYPGFTKEALDAIREKHASSEHETLVCLMVDGMSIRKQVEFDGFCYVGYVKLSLYKNATLLKWIFLV